MAGRRDDKGMITNSCPLKGKRKEETICRRPQFLFSIFFPLFSPSFRGKFIRAETPFLLFLEYQVGGRNLLPSAARIVTICVCVRESVCIPNKKKNAMKQRSPHFMHPVYLDIFLLKVISLFLLLFCIGNLGKTYW